MGLSAPLNRAYTNKYSEPPKFYQYWWYFDINGYSTTETTIDITQQENL